MINKHARFHEHKEFKAPTMKSKASKTKSTAKKFTLPKYGNRTKTK